MGLFLVFNPLTFYASSLSGVCICVSLGTGELFSPNEKYSLFALSIT
jgi:hypothetical protein